MKRNPPRIAALLIGLLLAGSASVASAAPTASSGSWFHYVVQEVECAFGNQNACMAAAGGTGTVSPDTGDGDPSINNK